MKQSKEVLDEITAIQLIALKSLENPDLESQFRKLARWFSKTFHTSYFDVIRDMTFQDLLLHRYEWTLENAEPAEIGKIRKQLLHKEEIETVEAEDEDWIEKEIRQLKEEEQKLKDIKQKPVIELKKEQIAELVDNFPNISMKF